MKVDIERKLVRFIPETPLEEAELSTLWRRIISCAGISKKLAPVGEFIAGKGGCASFHIEGMTDEETETIESFAQEAGTYYCSICNKSVPLAEGDEFPLLRQENDTHRLTNNPENNMAKLTGLQIQKLLPQTNCKECGSNTCLAFAMKLAAKKADFQECPYASDEAKQVLGAASEPPVKIIVLGPDKKLKLGEETVLYRHDKTFVNQTILAININDTDKPEAIEKTLKSIRDYVLERVGEKLASIMVSVTDRSGDPANFAAVCQKAYETTRTSARNP